MIQGIKYIQLGPSSLPPLINMIDMIEFRLITYRTYRACRPSIIKLIDIMISAIIATGIEACLCMYIHSIHDSHCRWDRRRVVGRTVTVVTYCNLYTPSLYLEFQAEYWRMEMHEDELSLLFWRLCR